MSKQWKIQKNSDLATIANSLEGTYIGDKDLIVLGKIAFAFSVKAKASMKYNWVEIKTADANGNGVWIAQV